MNMVTDRDLQRILAVGFLVITLALLVTSVEAQPPSPPYPFPPTFPVNNFDFTVTPSTTLIKIQQGESGGLVVWVAPYCPNSTTTIRCDSTVLLTITLTISGCPSGAYCALDRQQVQMPPDYEAGSNFIIYTFSTVTATNNLVAPITVTGVDQFGVSHSATFGVIICDC